MKTYIVACLLAVSGLFATAEASEYTLPDAAVYVVPNTLNNETVVTVEGLTYRGPSAFVYVSECAKADIPYRYRCDIFSETGVVLTSLPSGATITVSITYQQSYTLQTSGRNYWKPNSVLLDGLVTTP